LVGGCGEEGVSEGAVLSAYVSHSLCAEARQVLEDAGSRAGDFRLRAVCVTDETGAGDARLAAIGAAARRATEDSSSVAYIGTRDRTAVRFSEPILEAAGVARISASSGSTSMRSLMRELRRGEPGVPPRELVSN
jgi:hypothetical protein